MSDTIFELYDRPIEGKKLKVIERDDQGNIVAIYDAYYRPRKFSFAIYPKYSPIPGRRGKRQSVSDIQMRRKWD